MIYNSTRNINLFKNKKKTKLEESFFKSKILRGKKKNVTCIRCQAQIQAALEKTGAIPSTNLQKMEQKFQLKNGEYIELYLIFQMQV